VPELLKSSLASSVKLQVIEMKLEIKYFSILLPLKLCNLVLRLTGREGAKNVRK
jgi:hypothetical protein